jgi:multicomponent Na+:H+ antiporter subunit G
MGLTAQSIAAAILLGIGVVACLISCLGILAMRTAYDRLHYLAALGTVGPVAVVAAVVVEEGLSSGGLKALVVLAVILVTGPVLTHAIARAARIREGRGSREAGRR